MHRKNKKELAGPLFATLHMVLYLYCNMKEEETGIVALSFMRAAILLSAQ